MSYYLLWEVPMRPQGSPAELERRRLRAIDLLQRDIPVHVVAERLGVDRRSVRARFPRLDPDRSERQGRCIRASTTLALWHEQASLDKKRQISTCYLRRYICGGAIHRRRDREANRCIGKRYEGSIRESASIDLDFEFSPQPVVLFHPAQKCRCLAKVGRQAVSDPRRCITIGLPFTSPNVTKHRVIIRGVAAEIFFDAGKGRLQNALARQNESLKRSRHSSVSIGKRMNHDEIEMGQCRPNHDRRIVRSIQRLDEFAHQFRQKPGVRPLVHNLVRRFAAHKDRSWAPSARMFRKVVADHHVVQAAKDALVICKMGIVRKLENIREGGAIAGNRRPCFLRRVDWLDAFNGGHGIFERDVVPLDAIRSLNSASECRPPERTCPSPRRSGRIAHLFPDFFDLLDNRHLARAKRRGYKQHWCSLPSVCVPDTDNICSADGVNYYIIASLES